MFGIGIIILVFVAAFALGKWTDQPTTLQTIYSKTRSMSFGLLCGQPKPDIYQFRGAINSFHERYHEEVPSTWEGVQLLVVQSIPAKEKLLREQAVIMVGQIRTMGKKYADAENDDFTNPIIQQRVVDTSVKGLKAGSKQAIEAKGKNCPPPLLGGR